MHTWAKELGLATEGALRDFYINLHPNILIEKAVQGFEGKFAKGGGFLLPTGKSTENNLQFRYTVKDQKTEKKLDWSSNFREISSANFQGLKEKALEYLNTDSDIFISTKSIGNPTKFKKNVLFISTSSLNTLYFENSFYPGKEEVDLKNDIVILHAPTMMFDPNEFEVEAEVTIAINFEERMGIIIGTPFSGEIKKVTSALYAYQALDKGFLPLSASAHQDMGKGSVCLFMGGNNTGKTLLACDENKIIMGDDEICFDGNEIFGLQAGCYPRVDDLDKEINPLIYKVSNTFGSILENVTLNEVNRAPKFGDGYSEKARSNFQLELLEENGLRIRDSFSTVDHIFMLIKDPFGVLPPLAQLTPEQALQYYVVGYNAEIVRSEDGILIPKAAFYPGFDQLLLLEKPETHIKLFKNFLAKFNSQVWLINTGWSGGAFGGNGKRISFEQTRSLIQAVQKGDLKQFEFISDPFFNFKTVTKIPGLIMKNLNPAESWSDKKTYEGAAKDLAGHFLEQAKKYHY